MASAEINNDQGKRIDERPNYFAGQYLLEDDFRLEQEYHIDRQRHHNYLLHVSGIAIGLKVEPDGELKVKVTAGTAIDFQGKQIILIGNKNVDLEQDAHNKNPIQNGDYILSIKYNEELTAPQGNEANARSRVQEKPVFELSDLATANVIALAKLTIKGKEIEKIDPSVRQYSGINLPTEDGKGVTLRSSHGNENPNLAVLAGSLSISGALEVKGESTLTGHVKANGSLTVNNGGKGLIAQFTQQGLGDGVRISGVKGDNTALFIDTNQTNKSTLYVENEGKGATLSVVNKGSGHIAQFMQKASGQGVWIGGVEGENNALYIAATKTDKSTLYVENEGKGTTLDVRQTGTGKAAEFKGKVRVDGDAELTGSLSISKALAVTGEITLTRNTNIRGKLQVEGGIKSPALQSIYKTAQAWEASSNGSQWQTVIAYTFNSTANYPEPVYATVIANGHGMQAGSPGNALEVVICINGKAAGGTDPSSQIYGMGLTHANNWVPIMATMHAIVQLTNNLKIEVKMRSRHNNERVYFCGASMLILLTGVQ